MDVALVGIGNSRWIAGVQYHHSLLFGNSLLPPAERLSFRVYLEEDVHSAVDYAPVRGLAHGIWSTDFFPRAPRPFTRKLRKMARIIVRQRRLPQFPRSNLPALVRKHGAQVLFTANGLEADVAIPQVCWIPDFQHLNHPEFFSDEELTRRDAAFARIFSDSARIVVSNQCGYEDAVRHFPTARDRVVVLPFVMFLGEDWRKPDAHAAARRLGFPRKFVLFPAQFWKHKNHACLFEAVRQVRERPGCEDFVLVCTGHPHDTRAPDHAPKLRNFIREHRLEDAIHILGLIPREDQVQLMRAAAAIAQPSFFEGWSALVEESRSLGNIILASDIPMHREQAYEGMHLFDPNSPESLADLCASLWPGLPPGPDDAREKAAERAYTRRIADFARNFMNICREVARERPWPS